MRFGSTIGFLVGALLFLLPFVEVKCNNMTIAKNTGLGLAIGSEFKVSADMNMGDQNTELNTTKTTKEKGKMYIVAAVALGLGVLGFLLSLVAKGSSKAVTGIIGLAAAACLIVLMFQVKPDIETELKNSGGGDNSLDQFTSSMKPVASFTLWYYLSVASFLAAAIMSFVNPVRRVTLSAPPNAPQVPIHNPGEQTEFPGAPPTTEER